MIEIAPSILSADFGALAADVKKIEKCCKYLHVDVMDGHYVPNISLGVPVVKSLRKHTEMIFDVHLMISDPDFYVKAFADSGADMISFHIECCDDCSALIKKIKDLGCKAGVAIHPDTPIEKILPYVSEADYILIMSVRPGFGGQSYMDGSSERLSVLRKAIDDAGSDCILEVDGGINLKTVKEAHEAGAELLVAGSAVFGKEDPAAAVEELLSCARA